MRDFSEIVKSKDALRAIVGSPIERVRAKTSAALDDHCRRFIARCPFVLVASSDAAGNMDVSPKGDRPGFVRVLDDSTLAIPDRPGNRRADTFGNILEQPGVGLLFLVPGRPETLRVNGSGMVVRDGWLRDDMAMAGKIPELALVVRAREVFFHCPKCMVRSRLWEPDHWPDHDGLASFARLVIDRSRVDTSLEEMEEIVARGTRERLY